MKTLLKLWRDDEAQGLVEYLLILALIAFSAIAGMTTLANGLNSAFEMVSSKLGQYIH